MKRMKCYIYTRVSTSMQVDGYSLDAQKDKLRKYAEFQNMPVAGEYCDEGKSGKNIHCVITVKKAHKERAALICCLRFDDRSRADRADKSRHGKNRKADQKQRGKNLTDICKKLSRAE